MVAIVSAILVNAPGVGQTIAAKLCEAMTFGEGSCEFPGNVGTDPHLPDEPCVLVGSSDDRTMSVSVTFITAEAGGTIKVEEMSDDTFRVSAASDLGAGVTAGVGAGLTVSVQDRSWGGQLSAGLPRCSTRVPGRRTSLGSGSRPCDRRARARLVPK